MEKQKELQALLVFLMKVDLGFQKQNMEVLIYLEEID